MRTLYIECNMGAAGDMLMSALYELMDEEQKEEFLKRMNGLGLPGVRITPRKSSTCGISGTHMEVTVYGEEEHEPGEEHAGCATMQERSTMQSRTPRQKPTAARWNRYISMR